MQKTPNFKHFTPVISLQMNTCVGSNCLSIFMWFLHNGFGPVLA